MEFKNCGVLLLLACSTCIILAMSYEINVVDHGAVGDGKTDDSNAFMSAWKATCVDPNNPTMLVPGGKTFLLSPIIFEGPCHSSVNIQVDGGLIAPGSKWSMDKNKYWIIFEYVDHLNIYGSGQFDGNGKIWWPCRESKKCSKAPYAIGFDKCNDLKLSGLTFQNSPMKHVAIYNSVKIFVTGLTIIAPADSPNTDGLYISSSQNVEVTNSTIGTGDDCIAIGDESSNINITQINCGPGHGISVGSLGKNGVEASVQHVHVSYSSFFGTTNGARIKTWQGGRGGARDITFTNLYFENVANPIIIDQFYCNGKHNCGTKGSAVQISDVHYVGVRGTTTSDYAIILNCSESVPCTGIVMQDVDIRPSGGAPGDAECHNASGQEAGSVVPEVPCLKHGY